ncbi:MAG TPA: alpha/beta hydrolase [Longimicrobium sp.]
MGVPARVVVGARAPVVPRWFAESVAAALPGARCIVIPRAAHAINFDAAERFNTAILDFLCEIGHADAGPLPDTALRWR